MGRRTGDRLRRRTAAYAPSAAAGSSRPATIPNSRPSPTCCPTRRPCSTARSSPSTPTGGPSFERLQHRMHVEHPDAAADPPGARPLRRLRPALTSDGHALYDLPYRDRRALLDELELAAGPIEAPPYLPGTRRRAGRELLDYTREQGLEGLIAKRLDSPYRPGRRVDFWRKIKNFQHAGRRHRRLEGRPRAA